MDRTVSKSHIREVSLTAAPSHIEAVDGLRGLAALMIVVFHLFGEMSGPAWRPLFGINVLRPVHDFWWGVNLFLVLSGFCLFWPYARDPRRKLHFVEFMKRRARRVIPAYYAAMLIVPVLTVVIVWGSGLQIHRVLLPHGWHDVLLHALLLHSLTPETLHSWHPPAWSLGVEWIWYLGFPLAVWLFRRAGAVWGMVILTLVTVGYRVGLY
ncbi:MAG: acyltransferase family protein, partial [Tepidisphaeraceae bacterium]